MMERQIRNQDMKKKILEAIREEDDYHIDIGIWDYIADSESVDLCVWVYNEDRTEIILDMYVIEISEADEDMIDEHFDRLYIEAKKVYKYLHQHFDNITLHDHALIV